MLQGRPLGVAFGVSGDPSNSSLAQARGSDSRFNERKHELPLPLARYAEREGRHEVHAERPQSHDTRFAVLLAVALVGTGWAATAYRRRKTHGVTSVDRHALRPQES